jgi:predicted ATPase
VLLALAFRPAQASPQLLAAVDGAARAGGGVRLDLHPLAARDAVALVADRAPAGAVDELYRESGGNPFFLQELIRARSRERGSPPGDGPGAVAAGGVPASVRAALRTELRSLSRSAARLLRGGAIVGDPFEFDLARAAAEQREDEALAALDELVASELPPADSSCSHPGPRP